MVEFWPNNVWVEDDDVAKDDVIQGLADNVVGVYLTVIGVRAITGTIEPRAIRVIERPGQVFVRSTTNTDPDDGGVTTIVVTGSGTRYVSEALAEAGRSLLTAPRTYFVSTTGDDTNDGLTMGTPFLTLQKAVDEAVSLDFGIQSVTIRLADGTYTAGANFTGGWVGFGILSIVGNAADNTAVTVNVAGGTCIRNSGTLPARLQLQDMTLSAPGGVGRAIWNLGTGLITVKRIVFGECGNAHMLSNGNNSQLQSFGHEISGNTLNHMFAITGASITTTSAVVEINNSVNITNFCNANTGSIVQANAMTFNLNGNTVTGRRYIAATNAVINTGGGGANYFPGTLAGVALTGAQYV